MTSLTGARPAAAQTSDGAAPASQPADAAQAVATAPQTDAADDQPQTIVVTATKRKEFAQSVGSSVSVLSAAKLREQKLESLSDYVTQLPGVSANSSGTPGQSSLTIRGVSPLSAGSKVATYIDEAPLGSSGIWAQSGGLTLDLMPFDLQRLELLRGPQGTLYGAGSMGGLLKYVLTVPDTHKFGLDLAADAATVEGGKGFGHTLQAHANVPVLSDRLAFSASGFQKRTPGYVDNVYTKRNDTNGVDQSGGRLAVFWELSDDVTVKLNALQQTIDASDNAVESVATPSVQVAAGQPRLISGGTPYGRLVQSNAFAAPFESKVNFYSGTVDWDLGPATLTSASSWSKYDVSRFANRSLNNGTLLPALGLPEGLVLGHTALDTRKFTQELRLTSQDRGRLEWQVGGFYTHEDQSNVQTQDAFTTAYAPIAALAPDASYITIPTTYRESAVFADATWKIIDQLDISAGVRHSKNDQVYNLSARGALAGLPQLPLVTLNTIRSSESDTTWSLGSRYRFTPDVMAYVRLASGYAPGGANTPAPGVPTPVVESETLKSYEAGLKTELFDRSVLFDVSVFHIEWSNIQLGVRLGAVSYTDNAGTAKSDGVELSTQFRASRNLNFGLGAAYTDARLTALKPGVTTAFLLGRLQDVPEWSATATADYGWQFSNGWKAKVGAAVRRVDKQLGAQPAADAPLFTLPAYTLADLTANLVAGHTTFGLYVKNLANAKAYQGGYAYQDRTKAVRQIDYYPSQPRTVGVSAMYSF
jgi:outer membrane receptor protein involved in Fe transport